MNPAELKAALRAAGVRWRKTRWGLRFYLRTAKPHRMPDGSFWTGTEHMGGYHDWEQAAQCEWLASHANR